MSRSWRWSLIGVALVGLSGCGGGGGGGAGVDAGAQAPQETRIYRLPGLNGGGFENTLLDVMLNVPQGSGSVATFPTDPARVGVVFDSVDGRFAGTAGQVTGAGGTHLDGTVIATRQSGPQYRFAIELTSSGNGLTLVLSDDTGSVSGNGTRLAGGPSVASYRVASEATGLLVRSAELFGLLLPIPAGQGQFPGYDGTVTFGTAPVVTATRQGHDLNQVYDYGTGVTSRYSARRIVAGKMLLVGSDAGATGTADVTFDQLTLDGEAVTGSIHASFPGSGRSRQAVVSIPITATYSLRLGSTLSAEGSLELSVSNEGQLGLQFGRHKLTDAAGRVYDLVLNGLVINPVVNTNYLPQQGSVALTVDAGPAGGALQATLTFDQSSPGTRRVSVQVGNGTSQSIPVAGM